MAWLADKIKSNQLAGVMSIIGGFLLHLTLGTLYCFGNMNTYMTSYLRTHVPGQVSGKGSPQNKKKSKKSCDSVTF